MRETKVTRMTLRPYREAETTCIRMDSVWHDPAALP